MSIIIFFGFSLLVLFVSTVYVVVSIKNHIQQWRGRMQSRALINSARGSGERV